MAIFLSTVYLVLFFLIIILMKKIRLTWKQRGYCFLLFSISMATLAFNANPLTEWDLYRHFILMDNIRNSGTSIFQFLFTSSSIIGGYPTLISFNIMRFIICSLTENNHWLPCICVFIDYLIVSYIILDWHRTSNFGEGISIVDFLLCFTLLPPLHAFSGMRNVLAACIMGLAIYLYLYKKKNLIFFIIFAFIAVTIHQAVLTAIPFVLLSKTRLRKKGMIVVVLVSLSTNLIATWMFQSNIPFFVYIADRYFSYSSDQQFRGSIYVLWADCVLVVSFLLLFFFFGNMFKKLLWNHEQESLYLFLTYYMCFILGNIGNYDLLIRPCYILGVFSPVLLSLVENEFVWSQMHGKGLQLIGKFLCTLLCTLASYFYIRRIIEAAF